MYVIMCAGARRDQKQRRRPAAPSPQPPTTHPLKRDPGDDFGEGGFRFRERRALTTPTSQLPLAWGSQRPLSTTRIPESQPVHPAPQHRQREGRGYAEAGRRLSSRTPDRIRVHSAARTTPRGFPPRPPEVRHHWMSRLFRHGL